MKTFYKALLLLFLNVSLLVFNSFSQQAPGIEWQNTIGGDSTDQLNCIKQTSDGGYLLGGYSSSNISGDKNENSLGGYDYWVVKLDSAGSIQWQNTLGGSSNDYLYSLGLTTDGGYILGGYSYSGISGDKSQSNWDTTLATPDYWIVKIDSTGNKQWDKRYGGTSGDVLFSLHQTLDGGYILGGTTSSNISGNKTEDHYAGIYDGDYWVIKIDSIGAIQWQNDIGGFNNDNLRSIQQTNDGGYILGGYSHSDSSGDKTENTCNNNFTHDFWIVKLDTSGSIIWQNTIGGSDDEQLFSTFQTTDGGYFLAGESLSNSSCDKTENSLGNYDYWVLKLDSTGNIQWQNAIGGNDFDETWSANETNDHGYILGGFSNSNISGDKTENSLGDFDYWIIKLDSSGNIQWQNTIGGNDWDKLYSVQQTSDGGYVLGGSSVSNISGDKTENCLGQSDYWIVKLFPDTITSSFNIQHSAFNINISPNPSSGIFQITFPSSTQKINYTLEVINTLGQTVYQAPPRPSPVGREPTALSLDLSFLPTGLYLLKTITPEQTSSKIIVIQ